MLWPVIPATRLTDNSLLSRSSETFWYLFNKAEGEVLAPILRPLYFCLILASWIPSNWRILRWLFSISLPILNICSSIFATGFSLLFSMVSMLNCWIYKAIPFSWSISTKFKTSTTLLPRREISCIRRINWPHCAGVNWPHQSWSFKESFLTVESG